MSHEPLTTLSQAKSLAGKTIDNFEFARNGRELAGQIAVAEMQRLQDLMLDSDGVVDIWIAGDLDEQRRPWLHLEVRGELGLRCQRCLGRLAHVLEVDAHLRLIQPGEAWPEDEADGDGGVEVDDAIAVDESLDLMSLVEEEIILGLPYAPMHDACELPGEGESSRKASPFAALAVLKKH